MNKAERLVITRAIEYLHAQNYEASKQAKLLLFEATANYEHQKSAKVEAMPGPSKRKANCLSQELSR